MGRAAIVIGCLLGLVGVADAEEPTVSQDHTRRSATLYLASAFSPGPTVPVRVGADIALRIHHHHLALEIRGGGGAAGSVNAFGMELGAHVGGSVGLALPVGAHVVLAPMAAYDAFMTWEKGAQTLAVHQVTLEVPLAFIVRRGVLIEPFVQVGVSRYAGTNDWALVIGPRIGVVL